MTGVADLTARLETATGLTVHPPGRTNPTVPCIVLSPDPPAAWTAQPGWSQLFATYNVSVLVPLVPYMDGFDTLTGLVTDVLRGTAGTSYGWTATVEHVADPDAEPAYQGARLNVRFAVADLCAEVTS